MRRSQKYDQYRLCPLLKVRNQPKQLLTVYFYIQASVYRHPRFSEILYLLATTLRAANQLLAGCCDAGSAQDQMVPGSVIWAMAWQDWALRISRTWLRWSPVPKFWPDVGGSGGFVPKILALLSKIYTAELVPKLRRLPPPPTPPSPNPTS